MPGFPVTVTDDGPMVVATVRLPGIAPGRVIAAFTDPATLARWRSGEFFLPRLAALLSAAPEPAGPGPQTEERQPDW